MTYTEPLLLLCCMIALGGLVWVRPSRGRNVAVGGVLGLALVSWPPADWVLALPLEAPYPARPFQPPPDIQAIVVLGSAVRPRQYERPYMLPDYDTFKRCEHAIWIYRQWGPLPVLACEGRRSGAGPSVMVDLLRRGGIPENLVWLEEQSRSTRENALYGAQILRRHGVKHVALVVDAQSMTRAADCFRKVGIEVSSAPSEFRTVSSMREELLPSWRAIRRNEITLHELLGLAWYRLRGWI